MLKVGGRGSIRRKEGILKGEEENRGRKRGRGEGELIQGGKDLLSSLIKKNGLWGERKALKSIEGSTVFRR